MRKVKVCARNKVWSTCIMLTDVHKTELVTKERRER